MPHGADDGKAVRMIKIFDGRIRECLAIRVQLKLNIDRCRRGGRYLEMRLLLEINGLSSEENVPWELSTRTEYLRATQN